MRLKTIIDLAHDRNFAAPYADLDALYTHILGQLSDDARHLVLQIFYIILAQPTSYLDDYWGPRPSNHISVFQHLFDVTEDDILLALLSLSSILNISTRSIQLFHASFPDFLFDESRSGVFYIQGPDITGAVARACLRCIPRCKLRL